jgi:hypothetical protein
MALSTGVFRQGWQYHLRITTNVLPLRPNVTNVALTGVSTTTALGTLGVAFSVALTGVSGTFSAGTLTPSNAFTVSLTGVSSTTALGTLGKTFSVALHNRIKCS